MSFDVKRTHPNQGWKTYLFLVQLQLQIQLKPKIFNYNYSSSSNCNLITISITITLKTFSKHCNQFTYIRGLEFYLCQHQCRRQSKRREGALVESGEALK